MSSMVLAPRRHNKTSRVGETKLIRLLTTHLIRHSSSLRFGHQDFGYTNAYFRLPTIPPLSIPADGDLGLLRSVPGDRVIEGAGDIGPGNAPAAYKQSTALAGISARDQPAGLTIPASTHKVNTSSPTSYQGTLPAIRATGAATRAGQLYLKPVNLAQSTKLQAPVNPFDQPASAHRSTHLTGRPLRAGQLRLPARL